MEPLDSVELLKLVEEVGEEGDQIETFVSSDGKNTVHCKNLKHIETALKLFDFLKTVYGTKQGQAVKEYNKTEDLGKCAKCGAPNTRYKKSGKVGCSAFCWRKNI